MFVARYIGACAPAINDVNAQLAELVDASVSNTDRKLCRFDSGAGYKKKP